MDSASISKDKLAYFRVKELKDVLTQLGLPKQGKKQDLLDRIVSMIFDEQLANTPSCSRKKSVGKEQIEKIIDDIYRNMHIHGASELASKGNSGSDTKNRNHKERQVESSQSDMKVQCPCGSSLAVESMIQCEDSRCRVWQHVDCVIIPETTPKGISPIHPFYCEVCRLNRADPFWMTVAQPLLPAKLKSSDCGPDGLNPMQYLEKTFQLTKLDRDMLQGMEYEVQVWCILLNDKVPFRMQWPQNTELHVNSVQIRPTNRPGSQLLGVNGRDDGPVITPCTKEGINEISLSVCDARIFCLGVRIAKRHTVQQILEMIPKELEGERLEDAVARVCRCIGGGNATKDADNDSELVVVADFVTVNLRCPLSASRMKIAGRFKPCAHMGCFDLETFVDLNQRSRKWQCPICLKNYSLEDVIVDPYFNQITSMMRDCGEDVTEIQVNSEGSWRVRNGLVRTDLAQWHFPDGAVCIAMVKLEDERLEFSGHLSWKSGIKENSCNRVCEGNQPEHMGSHSSGRWSVERYDNHFVKCISSSASGSCKEPEDVSVNHDGGRRFDIAINSGSEPDSGSNFNPTGVSNRHPSASLGIADVIILSDSDDDENLISSVMHDSGQSKTGTIPFSAPAVGIHDSYPKDPDQVMGKNSCPDLINDDVGFGMPPTIFPFATQADSSLKLFATQVPGSVRRPSIDLNNSMVDSPLEFERIDISGNLLPSCPAAIMPSESIDGQDASSGLATEKWISLGFAGSDCDGSTGPGESASTNDVNQRPPLASVGRTESPTDAGALLISNGTPLKRQISSSLSSIPRQPRSVRLRCVTVDSNTE